jgi:AcrR family transcriptional regulator
MKESIKNKKEEVIIKAAEKIFSKVGFKNAKMEVIAKEAGITKVTLYSYFQSKENLYMAITYKALQLLTDQYYKIIDLHKSKPGLDSVITLTEYFMTFCEENYLYSEALLEYFALNRSTSQGSNDAKLTDALKESIYYLKLQDIQNLPFKLTVKEIERGKIDGSIDSSADAMLHTLHGWSIAVGYIKVISASGNPAATVFKVSLKELKKMNLKMCADLLKNNSTN